MHYTNLKLIFKNNRKEKEIIFVMYLNLIYTFIKLLPLMSLVKIIDFYNWNYN